MIYPSLVNGISYFIVIFESLFFSKKYIIIYWVHDVFLQLLVLTKIYSKICELRFF